jgi:hypothetical protein
MFHIDNQHLRVNFSLEEGISISVKANGSRFVQVPCPYMLSDASSDEESISYTLHAGGLSIRARLSFAASQEVVLDLHGEGAMDEDIAYPPAWQMAEHDAGVYPIGTGFAFPVNDPNIHIPVEIPFYSGTFSLALFGFIREGQHVFTAIEKGYDAVMRQLYPEDGLRHTQILWRSEKGQFGYPRQCRWFFADTLDDIAAAYRRWREGMGWVRTLKDKIRHTPSVAKLIGAADIWLWDDNAMNRLYGRPETDEVTPRDVRRAAKEMLELGMSKILWQSFEGESAEDCAWLKSQGFLVGKYDIYYDVLPKPIADLAIPYRKKRSVNTRHWPDIVRIDAQGNYAKAWAIHGQDGKMLDQHAVCDICSLRLTMENVPPDIAAIGYDSRLIDVQAGTILAECYHPLHPQSRSTAQRYINAQLDFLADIGLTVGVEVGSESASRSFHFAEGLLSPACYRGEDAGRRMNTLYYGEDIPPRVKQYMLNPRYRVPLWNLVYHDCSVGTWYWGDSSNGCPELMPVRDLFNALYGLPPLYSINMSQWDLLKKDIARSYHRATHSAGKTALSRMCSFEWLSPDGMIQQSRFTNGVSVIANFSDDPYSLDEQTIIPPKDFLCRE